MPVTWEVIWGIALIVFLVVEGVTVGLASIWFACGALAALISAFFGAPVWLQFLLFILVSGVTLWITRPLAARYINAKKQPTNADRIIGMIGIVTERIDNVSAVGAVSIGGKTWTARSQTGEIIPEDSRVVALAIDGVKLIVCSESQHQ